MLPRLCLMIEKTDIVTLWSLDRANLTLYRGKFSRSFWSCFDHFSSNHLLSSIVGRVKSVLEAKCSFFFWDTLKFFLCFMMLTSMKQMKIQLNVIDNLHHLPHPTQSTIRSYEVRPEQTKYIKLAETFRVTWINKLCLRSLTQQMQMLISQIQVGMQNNVKLLNLIGFIGLYFVVLHHALNASSKAYAYIIYCSVWIGGFWPKEWTIVFMIISTLTCMERWF